LKEKADLEHVIQNRNRHRRIKKTFQTERFKETDREDKQQRKSYVAVSHQNKVAVLFLGKRFYTMSYTY
jgi:hypothetical protein